MNFVPIKRKGPTFHNFNEEQKNSAIQLLKASISEEGYRKASEIMELEKALYKIENNQNYVPDGTTSYRDPLNYHFCIFGNPSDKGFWGWRFEGHHLSLNFTSSENKIVSSTPSFMGTNPAIVNVEGFEHKQVLKLETELGFKLVNSLSKEQLKVARFSETAPREIITENHRNAHNIEPKGISYSDFSDSQKATFMELLNVYINNYEDGFAEEFRNKITKAGIENLSFAWAGGLKPGEGHYYRIQGPMLLIEYDNTQNNANHVHSVVRDLTNDWADDLLKEHYHDHH
jgi:hypothetical protein